jgi:predicted permease
MQSFIQDLKYALRTLSGSPGFTLSVVLVLALGIGATTAIFSLVDATLIRPLPFADPDRLMMIWEDGSAMGYPKNNPAPANYIDLRADTRAFDGIAASSMGIWNLTGGGEPIRLEGVRVTANLAEVLGVAPALGRFFSAAEDRDGADPVLVIRAGLWQRRFGSDPGIVGTDIVVNDLPMTVVGVMPARMPYPSSGTDIWVPMAFSDEERLRRSSHYLRIVGRLRPDVDLEFVQNDLTRIVTRLEEDYPRTNTGYGLSAEPIHVQYTGDVRSGFLLLLTAVGAVLLIACANIANLLLVRSSGRGKEIAIRAALGAGRRRLIGQLLTESLLLSVTGGIFGMVLARVSFGFLSTLVPAGIAGAVPIEMDLRVMIVGLAVSLTTGLAFGIIPAMSVSRVRLNETLQRMSGRVGVSGASRRIRDVLVVGEVSLSVALLIGAGLLIRSFDSVRRVDPGYRAENVLTVRTDLSFGKYAETSWRHGFCREVLERVAALPGVESAGYTSFVPLTNGGGSMGFTIEGRP